MCRTVLVTCYLSVTDVNVCLVHGAERVMWSPGHALCLISVDSTSANGDLSKTNKQSQLNEYILTETGLRLETKGIHSCFVPVLNLWPHSIMEVMMTSTV